MPGSLAVTTGKPAGKQILDPGEIDADGFAARSQVARHCSATTVSIIRHCRVPSTENASSWRPASCSSKKNLNVSLPVGPPEFNGMRLKPAVPFPNNRVLALFVSSARP